MGTGTYGQSNPTVINCGFKPKYVYVYNFASKTTSTRTVFVKHLIGFDYIQGSEVNSTNAFLFVDALPREITICNYPGTITLTVDFNANGISFYAENKDGQAMASILPAQLNVPTQGGLSTRYYYVAIG